MLTLSCPHHFWQHGAGRKRQHVSSKLALLLLLLVGCEQVGTGSGGNTNSAGPIARTAPGAPSTTAATETAQDFVYASVGKRDPFRSYLLDIKESSSQDLEQRRREATEQFELHQYRLTGLITGTARPKAMVEDPQGRGHVLHVGSRLGRNNGRISQIIPTGITVHEEVRDATGKKTRVPVQIPMPKSDIELLANDKGEEKQ